MAQTYVNAAQSPVAFWAWTRVSGHLRDAVRNGARKGALNPIDNEFVAGFEDLRDLMNTTFMASTYGLELIVDDGSTYAGIAQSTNAHWLPTVTNQNGALTRAGMLNTDEAARDNDKGGRPSIN